MASERSKRIANDLMRFEEALADEVKATTGVDSTIVFMSETAWTMVGNPMDRVALIDYLTKTGLVLVETSENVGFGEYCAHFAYEGKVK